MAEKMNMNKARRIGMAKLKIDRGLFDRCKVACQRIDVQAEDLPVMTLALGVLGLADLKQSDMGEELAGELTDALSVISKAEKEFDMEMKLAAQNSQKFPI